MALIEAHEVMRVYQMGTTLVTALDHVTMGVNEGEFVSIQGTSGSGKSTLLNLLGGLDRPTSGDVLFDSKPLGPLTKKEMARYRRAHLSQAQHSNFAYCSHRALGIEAGEYNDRRIRS